MTRLLKKRRHQMAGSGGRGGAASHRHRSHVEHRNPTGSLSRQLDRAISVPLKRTNRVAPLGWSRSMVQLGRQGETPLRIASLYFEFCTFAPTASDQLKPPSSTAEANAPCEGVGGPE